MINMVLGGPRQRERWYSNDFPRQKNATLMEDRYVYDKTMVYTTNGIKTHGKGGVFFLSILFFFLAFFSFFGWLWLLAFGSWLFGFWLWLLASSGFWLLLAFGFFWHRTSGFCGFWLGCNSAWIFFIVCMDLLYILYQFFISSMSFSIFVWISCNSSWVFFLH